MADSKPEIKTTTTKPAASAPASLKPAGESSDPTVQTLLAELQSARLNDNGDGVDEILNRLAELGYSAE